MFRKIFLAVAIVGASMLAMAPDQADARWGARRYYRGPARVSVGYGYGYGPRYYRAARPYRSYYGPRTYGPRYYGGYGGGVMVRPGGIYVGW